MKCDTNLRLTAVTETRGGVCNIMSEYIDLYELYIYAYFTSPLERRLKLLLEPPAALSQG
jgi:hypothetical protein